MVETVWVEPSNHDAAMLAVLSANRRGLSFADCTSFQLMHRLRIRHAFAFDRHFDEQLAR